jgi:hypothetical protein
MSYSIGEGAEGLPQDVRELVDSGDVQRRLHQVGDVLHL